MGRYDDMLEMPHHQSETRPHMSMVDRAAQFAPFAALTGYDGQVKEAGRLTEQKIELDETEKQVLNNRFSLLHEHLGDRLLVKITHFKQDLRKEGGAYCIKTGILKKIDAQTQSIVFEDGEMIRMQDVLTVENDELFGAE